MIKYIYIRIQRAFIDCNIIFYIFIIAIINIFFWITFNIFYFFLLWLGCQYIFFRSCWISVWILTPIFPIWDMIFILCNNLFNLCIFGFNNIFIIITNVNRQSNSWIRASISFCFIIMTKMINVIKLKL